MRVDSEGRPVDAEQLASRLRFNPEFAQKVPDEIQPGTAVVITDQPVVRNRNLIQRFSRSIEVGRMRPLL
jgi:hypothetical protein